MPTDSRSNSSLVENAAIPIQYGISCEERHVPAWMGHSRSRRAEVEGEALVEIWRLNGPFAEKKIHEAGKEGRAEENAWAVQRDPPRSLSGL